MSGDSRSCDFQGCVVITSASISCCSAQAVKPSCAQFRLWRITAWLPQQTSIGIVATTVRTLTMMMVVMTNEKSLYTASPVWKNRIFHYIPKLALQVKPFRHSCTEIDVIVVETFWSVCELGVVVCEGIENDCLLIRWQQGEKGKSNPEFDTRSNEGLFVWHAWLLCCSTLLQQYCFYHASARIAVLPVQRFMVLVAHFNFTFSDWGCQTVLKTFNS